MKPSLEQKLGTTGIKRQSSTKPAASTRMNNTKKIKTQTPFELSDDDIKMDIDIKEGLSTTDTKRQTRGKRIDLTAVFQSDSDDPYQQLYHSTSDEFELPPANDVEDEFDMEDADNPVIASKRKKPVVAQKTVTSTKIARMPSIQIAGPIKREVHADKPLPSVETPQAAALLTPPASHQKSKHFTSRVSPFYEDDPRTYKPGPMRALGRHDSAVSGVPTVNERNSKTASPAKSLGVKNLPTYQIATYPRSNTGMTTSATTVHERSTTPDGGGSVPSMEKEMENGQSSSCNYSSHPHTDDSARQRQQPLFS